jgi:hypothetical protein
MATLSSDGLQALLGGLGVESPIPSFPLADIKNSPMDIYLSYLAEILVQLVECVPQVAYQSIQWPNETGDLAVVLPRLRLKDVNPNDLAVELKKRVGSDALFLLRPISVNLTRITETSSQPPPFLAIHSMTELIFGFSFPPELLPAYFCLTSLIVGPCTGTTSQLDFESSIQLTAIAKRLWWSFHRPILERSLMARTCEALLLAHTSRHYTRVWVGM